MAPPPPPPGAAAGPAHTHTHHGLILHDNRTVPRADEKQRHEFAELLSQMVSGASTKTSRPATQVSRRLSVAHATAITEEASNSLITYESLASLASENLCFDEGCYHE